MVERLQSLLVPCLILLASVYASLYVGTLPPLWFGLLPFFPFILSVVALLLSWHFNKGRVLILVCLLLIPKVHTGGDEASVTAYLVVSCFCIALLSFVKERGFFNRFVVNRFLFVCMLLGWCFAVESGWVSFGFLDQPIFHSQITWSSFLLWLVLCFSTLLVLIGWWASGDNFQASGLISIVSLIVLTNLSVSQSQFDALLSAQFLLWIWFLLMESHRMAYLDELTRLPGRRALNEKLVGLPKKYALAMVDVDHFKKFNDTYGHDMGDIVLKNVASQLKCYAHPGRAYRYGGEEFAVVFRHNGLAGVVDALEEIRAQVELAEVLVFDPKKKKEVMVNVTVSVGVAFASQGEFPDDVLKRADEALYQAKRKGRNQVTQAPALKK
ncbi:GGDEF domain-containing protein [Marinomonas pollencensis]|uniref:diguanylate cyclase n=1 Tax=Marinomonas pollencensis TaxID=491954 RepID=A0A3E0DVT0_9GAMM|nr:GGDEF domain-containing protein [Marinomonas pollencensis]REG87018.1 diguanylate cyclase (GGDEF)-like protein [Marinomonas pollencensis]